MEHFKSPFGVSDLVSRRAVQNQSFFHDMADRARRHSFFSHPFLSACDEVALPRDLVSFILTSLYKLVSPFTGLRCSLGGRAPDLRSRFALTDSIYEEMGRGDLSAAHSSLYLKLLASIGIPTEVAELIPALPAIRRIDDHLRDVVERRPFSIGCAVLALAESTFQSSAPSLARMARRAFADVDLTFFDRHGPRAGGRSDDAAMLFAIHGNSSQFATVEAEVKRDLSYRCELFDEWMVAMRGGAARSGRDTRERPGPAQPA